MTSTLPTCPCNSARPTPSSCNEWAATILRSGRTARARGAGFSRSTASCSQRGPSRLTLHLPSEPHGGANATAHRYGRPSVQALTGHHAVVTCPYQMANLLTDNSPLPLPRHSFLASFQQHVQGLDLSRVADQRPSGSIRETWRTFTVGLSH